MTQPAAQSQPKQRANILLEKILSEDPTLVADVAKALVTSPEIIREYQAGLVIPIERQMLLAAYAIELSPKYARLGYGLRGQIRATIAFAARETETHSASPPPRTRWS